MEGGGGNWGGAWDEEICGSLKEDFRGSGSGAVYRNDGGGISKAGEERNGGSMVAYDPCCHQDTIPPCRRSPFVCADLSAYLYFFIMNFRPARA